MNVFVIDIEVQDVQLAQQLPTIQRRSALTSARSCLGMILVVSGWAE